MTAALEGSEWSAARPGRTLPPGKTRYPFYSRLGGPQGRSGRAENLVPTGVRCPDRPALSQSRTLIPPNIILKTFLSKSASRLSASLLNVRPTVFESAHFGTTCSLSPQRSPVWSHSTHFIGYYGHASVSSGDILHSPHVCFPIFFKIQLLLFYFEIVHVARNFRVSFFFNLNINQIDALNFVISLFRASKCFEHKCSSSGDQNCTIQPLISSHL